VYLWSPRVLLKTVWTWFEDSTFNGSRGHDTRKYLLAAINHVNSDSAGVSPAVEPIAYINCYYLVAYIQPDWGKKKTRLNHFGSMPTGVSKRQRAVGPTNIPQWWSLAAAIWSRTLSVRISNHNEPTAQIAYSCFTTKGTAYKPESHFNETNRSGSVWRSLEPPAITKTFFLVGPWPSMARTENHLPQARSNKCLRFRKRETALFTPAKSKMVDGTTTHKG
jgi:hypothetical protein